MMGIRQGVRFSFSENLKMRIDIYQTGFALFCAL